MFLIRNLTKSKNLETKRKGGKGERAEEKREEGRRVGVKRGEGERKGEMERKREREAAGVPATLLAI